MLPPDIAVREAVEVHNSFDPRREACARVYEYRIINRELRSALEYRYTWHVREPLDLAAMETAAGLFLGRARLRRFPHAGDGDQNHDQANSSQSMGAARGSARLPHRGKQLPAPDGALDGRGDGRGGTRPDERGGDKRAAQRWRPRRRAGGGASLRFVSRRGTLSTVVIPGRRWRRAGSCRPRTLAPAHPGAVGRIVRWPGRQRMRASASV